MADHADSAAPPSQGASTEEASSKAKKRSHSEVNWPVFAGTSVIIVAFVLWAAIWPEAASTAIFGAMGWVATNFGWYYILTATIVVVFVIIVAFSRVGRTKMGPDHSRPNFNMFTWAAMLFAAGIGVDLMFFGISGPATNYLTPPDVGPMSDEAARMAPIWTIFHYGIPGWAMYALMGMAFGLFAYRYHLPLSIRSALAPIFGKRIHGIAGHSVEIAATIGTIFGISVSLGIGVVFLNYGLSELFGIPNSLGCRSLSWLSPCSSPSPRRSRASTRAFAACPSSTCSSRSRSCCGCCFPGKPRTCSTRSSRISATSSRASRR